MPRGEEKSIGILLAREPDTPSARWAVAIARVAAGRGLRVRLFLTAQGVDLLARPEARDLDRAGVELMACSHSAIRRDRMGEEGVDYASQFQLAGLIGECDRFVSFA